MKKTSRAYRAAIAGYYGFGNLGDDLLAQACVFLLEEAGVPRSKMLLLTASPDAESDFLGVRTVSRWDIKAVTSALRQSETLLLGGGGLFQDSTSFRSCLWYWGLIRLARLCGVRPWALGQSVGPLHSFFADWLARDALKRCCVLHLRDRPSEDWAAKRGFDFSPGEDLALTLCTGGETPEMHESSSVLLNLRPHASTEKFVSLLEERRQKISGDFVGVAFSGEDEGLLSDVQGRLGLTRIERPRSMEEARKLFLSAEVAIGMRLHFAVLATLFKVPLAVFPYDPKVSAFAEKVRVPSLLLGWASPRLPSFPGSVREMKKKLIALAVQALEEKGGSGL